MLVENQIILKQLEGDPKNPGQPLLEAYNDGFGTWTIGWGHTSKVKQGDKITLTQAESYFQADVKEWETVVKINNFNKFTDKNKLDALTMFAFNKGYGVLKLMFRIKEDPSYSNVSRVWRSYDIIKGKHSVGLLNRRNKELEVFFKNDALEIQESQKIVKKQEEQQVQIEEIKKKTVRFIRYTVLVDTTVDEFINNNQSLVPNISKEDLLKFNPEGNRSNADLIYSKYTQEEQYNNKENLSTFNLDPIKVNTTILIPLSELQEQLYITGGKNLFIDQNKGLSAYFIEEQIKLQQDSRYVKMDKLYQFGEVDVQTIEENCQVWIYVKAIDKLLDVSSFINSLTTSKTDIGQFSIDLNPIEIQINRQTNEIEAIFISSMNGREYLNDYEIKKMDRTLHVSFFEKYCQQNDCVFIRFEKLQLEEDINVTKFGSHQIEVSKVDLPSQIFDMIGLVDSVSSNFNLENSDCSIVISGRDLMKTLVEDGSYLMDLTFAQGAENMMFYLGDSQDKYFKRNFVSNGAFEYLFKEFFDPLDTYMGFIVNQLSNVGWTGDNDLFNYYPLDERPQKYKIGIENEQQYLDTVEQNGVWKISYIKMDSKLKDRRVIDSSFIDQDGTLYEQFKKVCQSPFVEFWGDTYGSKFNYIARQQPFTKKEMLDVLNTEGLVIDIETADTFQINLGWEDEFYSWVQFYPNNQSFGNDQFWLAASFPIIYFDKFIEHFGNHRLEVYDNYVSGRSVDVVEGKENKENVAIGLFNDLKYIIETISVLPFTRKGTIIINGDRRIKKGSFIRLKATGEICYVDSVVNNVGFSSSSINRTTSLSLKRCMREEFINGSGAGREEFSPYYSYFDIVNSNLIVNELIERFKKLEGLDKSNSITNISKQIKVNFGVDEQQFNFFLQRRQMDMV